MQATSRALFSPPPSSRPSPIRIGPSRVPPPSMPPLFYRFSHSKFPLVLLQFAPKSKKITWISGARDRQFSFDVGVIPKWHSGRLLFPLPSFNEHLLMTHFRVSEGSYLAPSSPLLPAQPFVRSRPDLHGPVCHACALFPIPFFVGNPRSFSFNSQSMANTFSPHLSFFVLSRVILFSA